jgi:membrane protein DedA with SNARE-associated domain
VLSVLGSVGAAALGFWVGRRGGKLLARIVSQEEAMQASTLLTRWGGLAIIVSRPIPILAETVAIMAGASSMRWRVLLVSSAAGALPAALLYALTGATAARLDNFLLTFGLVMAMAALFWALGRLFTPAATPLPKESSSQ